ncbi:MAG: Minf_1886 family protein [Phycisphaerales bacterium]
MANEQAFEIDWGRLEEIGPYPRQAYAFVQEGLGYTVRRIHRDFEKKEPGQRHVNGAELCAGLRDYAIKKYGLMARSVLEHWNIFSTDDFGRMVFAMVDEGIMSRTDEDSLDDFVSVFSFEDAFSAERVLNHLDTN